MQVYILNERLLIYLASNGFAIKSNISAADFSSEDPCSSISRKGVIVIGTNKMDCSTSG